VRAVIEVKSNLQRGAGFISALMQLARARELLASDGPVFSALFSFGAPADPVTLRDWLADLVALRQLLATKQGPPSIIKIRDALLAAEDEDVRVADENALLDLLDNSNLPDVIAADHGAVTRKVGGQGASDFYMFLGRGDGLPSVMVVIDHLIEQLGVTAPPNVNGALNDIRTHLAIEGRADPGSAAAAERQLPGRVGPGRHRAGRPGRGGREPSTRSARRARLIRRRPLAGPAGRLAWRLR
jgi:hypothetical protein